MPPRKKAKLEAALDESVPEPAVDSRLDALRLALASPTREHSVDLHDAVPLSAPLLEWYDKVFEDRAMPWRQKTTASELKALDQTAKTQRAYEVWLSETMCQQTQASRVIPYFERWLAAFPTLESLANGTQDKVRELWAGLGCVLSITACLTPADYSRATRLLDGAKVVVKDHRGRIPDTAAGLVKLPGIGPYTAGAIASIAFGEQVPAVDGNVERVLSRAFTLYGPSASKAFKNALQDLASQLVPADRPGDFNQALMDLGFSICTPKNPKCPTCPLADVCLAYAELRATEHPAPTPAPVDIEACDVCAPMDAEDVATPGPLRYPMRKVRKAPKEEATAVLVLESNDQKRVLVVQRPETGLLAGQYEFVAIDLPNSSSNGDKLLAKRLAEVLGKSVDIQDRMAEPEVVHRFTHQLRTYTPDSARCAGDDPKPTKGSRARWVDREELAKLPLGKAQRLIWAAHLEGKKRSSEPTAKRPRKTVKAVVVDDDEEEDEPIEDEVEAEASDSGETSDDAAGPVPPRVYTPRRRAEAKRFVEEAQSEDQASGSEFAVRAISSFELTFAAGL